MAVSPDSPDGDMADCLQAVSIPLHCCNKIPQTSQVPVAHACNPSYAEDRDQKDQGSKSARANNS
jgi:hypothetical protein